MDVVSRSIPGHRSQNEDSVFCWSGDVGETPCAVLAVADGMGGHRGGQEASRLAIEAVEEEWSLFCRDPENAETPRARRNWLKAAVREASEAIQRFRSENEDLSGMGTTLTVAQVCGDRAVFANVGDSRTYLVTETEILQVTEDHSAVAKFLREGKISEEEARDLPYKDALTRSLGGTSQAEPDLLPAPDAETWNGYSARDGELVVPENCALLSCSDGLTKELTDMEIYECLRHSPSLEKGTRQLVLSAYHKGSTDNVTVAALERGRVPRLEPRISEDPLPEEATQEDTAPSPNGVPENRISEDEILGDAPSESEGQKNGRTVRLLLVGLALLLLLLVTAYLWAAYGLPLQIPEELSLPAALGTAVGAPQARSWAFLTLPKGMTTQEK